MKTLDEMSTDILEAEGVRSRHDGVHEMHGYLTTLWFCRDTKMEERWLPAHLARSFDDTMRKIRVVNVTGFPPKRDLAGVTGFCAARTDASREIGAQVRSVAPYAQRHGSGTLRP